MTNIAGNQERAGEHGAISIKTLLVLVMVGAVAFMIIKLAPVYVEQTKVIHDVSELARVAAVRAWKEERINQDIKRIRGEYELPDNAINFVGSNDKGVQIAISYQRNVDLLVTTYTWKVDHTAIGKDL
jgi:flagellar basal body-associated protein FliL